MTSSFDLFRHREEKKKRLENVEPWKVMPTPKPTATPAFVCEREMKKDIVTTLNEWFRNAADIDVDDDDDDDDDVDGNDKAEAFGDTWVRNCRKSWD